MPSVQDLQRVLAQLDGVVAVWLKYANEWATVACDPAGGTALEMVIAIRSIADDTPVEQLTLRSDDLLYTPSA